MNKFNGFGLLMLILFALPSISAQRADGGAVITLERTACFGACPVYTVDIFEDGTVAYQGDRFVTVTGQQTGEIPAATVKAMAEAFRDAGYFDWNDAYDAQPVSDLPTVITSVNLDGAAHSVVRYAGDSSAPLALPFLEQWIDEMANTALWTGIEPDITAISNGMDTPLITLQRAQNFGHGAAYNVAAYDDGTVVYMGIANVAMIGVHVFEVEASSVESIPQLAQVLGYFDWQDSYPERVITDQATVSTSIRWDDQFKRIARYEGDPNAPIGLVRIESSIEQFAMDFIR